MLGNLIEVLCCPVCGGRVDLAGSAVRCGTGHSFDVARQGYVNLLSGTRPPGTADTVAMVQARAEFLAAGHYEPLADRLAEVAYACSAGDADVIVDAGAGTGYYPAAVLGVLPSARGLALDISKHAARRAAKAHARLAAAVCDTWRRLPIADASAQIVLNVFAPRNGPEFHRILAPGGALVVVTPTARHLSGFPRPPGMLAVDAAKDDRLARSLGARLDLRDRHELDLPLVLSAADAERLVTMSPSAWHVDDDLLDRWRTALTEPVHATASVSVATYRPKTEVM